MQQKLMLAEVEVVIAQYSKDPNKDYKAAIEDFNPALRRDPGDAKAYAKRGSYEANLHNTAEILIETTRQRSRTLTRRCAEIPRRQKLMSSVVLSVVSFCTIWKL